MNNQVINNMKLNLSKGLDPFTGEKMETKGEIGFVKGILCDSTGKKVTLNKKGTWIYK